MLSLLGYSPFYHKLFFEVKNDDEHPFQVPHDSFNVELFRINLCSQEGQFCKYQRQGREHCDK